MIKVYFQSETANYSEQVATFETDDLYSLCHPILEKWAESNRGFITETEGEEE